MNRQAFVTIDRSTMPHLRGKVFYRVMRLDENGRMVPVADSTDYPWAWGFADIKHAFAVVDHVNNPDPESDIGTVTLVRMYAERERAACRDLLQSVLPDVSVTRKG
jgi:hypothetical protein